MTSRRPGILLCDATYYGTLAAARSLGRAGVPIFTVDASRVAPAYFSRFTRKRLRGPAVTDSDAFASWLLRFGERHPGTVLYPTSDEVSYVFAAHHDALAKHFALYQPDLPTMLRVLDKGKLLGEARAVGLHIPSTWLPETSADLERVAREADGPLVIKPRTQLFLSPHTKGALAPNGAVGLAAAFETFRRKNVYAPAFAAHVPEATMPMVQRYHSEATQSVYSLTGFFDRASGRLALLGANKILQRPRNLGIGLCFEEAPVEPDLAEKTRRLCVRLGFYGVFELEFIHANGRAMLIDMNPRFYNQMALDIARGLALPELAYAAARDDAAEVARLLDAAPKPSQRTGKARGFCNRFGLEVLVRTQRMFGAMTHDEAKRWRSWHDARGDGLVDAAFDRDDPGPYVADVLNQLYGHVRHPRAFLRMMTEEC